MQLQLILPVNSKQCTKCRAVKPLTEFHKNRGARDGLFLWCKECAKAHAKRRWEEFPEVREAHRIACQRFRARLTGVDAPFKPTSVYTLPADYRPAKRQSTKRRTIETGIFLRSVKTHVGCQVCDEREPDLLDYHHKNPAEKSFTLSQRAARNVSNPDRLIAEIKKCVCLCANCHRRHHFGKLDVEHIATIDDNAILSALSLSYTTT